MFASRASSMIRGAAALRSTVVKQTSTPAVSTVTSMMNYRFFSDDESQSNKGHVKWFDTKKGFGFITPSDGGGDVFVHQTVIYAEGFRSLAEGEEVVYDVQIDESGRRSASNVTGPDGAYVQGAPRRQPYYNNGDDNEGY